eukprot:8333702-Alexandrium_andersonii.AAC.1
MLVHLRTHRRNARPKSSLSPQTQTDDHLGAGHRGSWLMKTELRGDSFRSPVRTSAHHPQVLQPRLPENRAWPAPFAAFVAS